VRILKLLDILLALPLCPLERTRFATYSREFLSNPGGR
jgi:hypothetical protein